MGILTADQVMAADDYREEEVPVPAWGGSVMVRSLTETEYDDFQDSIYKQRGKNVQANLKVIRVRLCALTIVGPDRKPIFTEEQLGRKSAAAISTVMRVAMRLNGMDDSDVEELAKNSETAQGGGSPSNSPSPSAAGTSTS